MTLFAIVGIVACIAALGFFIAWLDDVMPTEIEERHNDTLPESRFPKW